MKFSQLSGQVARLESLNDQLSSEIAHVDNLLKKLGFEEGLETLKSAASEVLDYNISDLN